ncbi:MAG: ABC transporter ATP-binding protein [Chloroflexi bacterium]|nr:ABC transporter ATP-binding protein [Chloroflexota bacterium]OJW05453.1 MAG: peptide ABC transporter ATP-binding protein [Chloroflexi bacterium 54-19]
MKETKTVAPILEVKDLIVEYPGGFGKPAKRVIDGVSFNIAPGETLALVGESGSGKSTIGNTILGLTKATGGQINFEGADITYLNLKNRRKFAADLQAIFQNPYGSLNPGLKIKDILTEPLQVQRKLSSQEAGRIVTELLQRVGMPANSGDRYPSHFSGGQRQRIAIARAVSVKPKLIICDEATSALDVSTQAAVLELLAELKRDFNLAMLFITHHLAIVRNFADNVIVLNKGQIVEYGPAKQVCDNPQDLYTQLLVAAVPVPDPLAQAQRRKERHEKLLVLAKGTA